MARRITPEASLLSAVLDLLAAERIWHLRMNTGAVAAEHNGQRRFIRYGRPGCADILAVVVRRDPWLCTVTGQDVYIQPLWLEVKSATGRQSPEQKAFQQEVEAAGMVYRLVRDVDELRAYLRAQGAIR